MATPIEVTLTGSDSPVEGQAHPVKIIGYTDGYEFRSTDETLHLIIGRDADGNWKRVDGTDPYFSGWVGELADQVSAAHPR